MAVLSKSHTSIPRLALKLIYHILPCHHHHPYLLHNLPCFRPFHRPYLRPFHLLPFLHPCHPCRLPFRPFLHPFHHPYRRPCHLHPSHHPFHPFLRPCHRLPCLPILAYGHQGEAS
uniref:Uncharacterized protein n=1 Tax=Ditylenchus dipsaci TaxID=166011 RepID=A0A915DJ86_9BILA